MHQRMLHNSTAAMFITLGGCAYIYDEYMLAKVLVIVAAFVFLRGVTRGTFTGIDIEPFEGYAVMFGIMVVIATICTCYIFAGELWQWVMSVGLYLWNNITTVTLVAIAASTTALLTMCSVLLHFLSRQMCEQESEDA